MAFNIAERYEAQSRLGKIFENDPSLPGSFLNSLSQAYYEREKKLFSQGYIIPLNLQLMGRLDQNYLEYVDNQVLNYNQKFPENPLLFNEELQKVTLANLNDSHGVDLSVNNFSDLISSLAASIGSSLASDVSRHPGLFLSTMAGGALLGSFFAGPLALPAAVSSALIGGILTSGLATRSAIVKNEVLQKAAPQVAQELGLEEDALTAGAEGFAEGLVAGAALNVVGSAIGKVARYSSNIGKKYAQIANAQIDNLAASARNAHPLERAQIADLLQTRQPSSILTQTETEVLAADLKNYLGALNENNLAEADFILRKQSPMPRITEEAINKTTELSVNFPERFDHLEIENVSSLQQSMQNSLNEFNFRFTEEELNGGRSTNQSIGPAEILGTQRVGPDSAAISSTTEQYILRNFPNSVELQLGDQLSGRISLIVENIAKAGMEFRGAGYTAADLKNLNGSQRELALRFNAARNELKFSEVAITAARNEAIKKRFSPKDLHNVVAQTTSNYRETIDAEVQRDIRRYASRLSEAIQSYNKGQGTFPDTAGVVDAVLGTGGSSKYLGIKNEIQNVFGQLRESSIRAGIEPLYEVEGYFPNSWSSAKFSKYPAREFVDDALQHFDLDKMKLIANRRNRPIANIEEFLFNMHKNIRNSNSEPSERIAVVRSGESWAFMHDKYGRYSTFEDALGSSIENAGYHIKTGLSGAPSLRAIRDSVDRIYSAILNSTEGEIPFSNKARNSFKNQLTDIMYESQFALYGDQNFFMPLLKIARTAMLAKAPITAYFTDRYASIPALARTLGSEYSEIFKIIASNLGPLKNKSLLSMYYDVSDNYSRRLGTTLNNIRSSSLRAKKPIGAIADALSTLYNGSSRALAAVSESNELISVQVFGHQLAQSSNLPWTQLKPILRSSLGNSGIAEADWEIYRMLPNFMLNNRTPLKTVNYLRSLRQEGNKTLENILKNNNIAEDVFDSVLGKFKTAETAAMRAGSPQSTALGRTAQPKPGSNPMTQALMYTLFPFINIGFSMYRINARTIKELIRTGYYGSAGIIPITLLTASCMAWYSKQLLNGNPKPELDANALLNIITNSGLLTFEQELAAEYIVGDHYTAAGFGSIPLVNTVVKAPYNRFIRGKEVNWYKTLSKEARQLNPIANLGMLGMLFNKYTTNIVFRFLDPEGAREADNELYRKYMQGDINELQYELMRPAFED